MAGDEAEEYPESRVLYELCSMIIHALKFPPLPMPIPFPFSAVAHHSRSALAGPSRQPPALSYPSSSPTAFASLFLGISLSLMMFGSLAFVIGFLLMPWALVLMPVFYFAGILSKLSQIGRSVVILYSTK